MTSVANNPGEFSIGSLGDHTGWFRNNSIEDIGFSITGTWVGTISLEVSNQDTETKTRTSAITSYTANQSPLNIPRQVGRYFRFIFSAYTSGVAYIGISQGVSTDNKLFDFVPQGHNSV